jgi:hypothetical protein
MPNSAVTVNAHFIPISGTSHTVTISSAGSWASGGGTYAQGATVYINAGTPPAGQQFSHWTSNPAVFINNTNNANTSFIMPAYNVTMTAHFTQTSITHPHSTVSLRNNDATNITHTSASLSANLTVGSGIITEKGFVYSSRTQNPSYHRDSRTAHSNTVSGNFTVDIHHLMPKTTYYFSAYAVLNTGEVIYADSVRTFRTTPASGDGGTVKFSMRDAHSVTHNSAILTANLTLGGGSTIREKGFVFSRINREPMLFDQNVSHSSTGSGEFSVPISSLLANVTYYFRAYATLSTGETIYSTTIGAFTTREASATVTVRNTGIENVTLNSATLTAVLNTGGEADMILEKGFVYSSTNTIPTALRDTKIMHPNNTTGIYNVTINHLLPGITYYYRAYAVLFNGEVVYAIEPGSFITQVQVTIPTPAPITSTPGESTPWTPPSLSNDVFMPSGSRTPAHTVPNIPLPTGNVTNDLNSLFTPTHTMPNFPLPSNNNDLNAIGSVLYSDIIAFVNGHAIPTYVTSDGKAFIVAEDLRNYGFDVIWNGENMTLSINRNRNNPITPLTVERSIMPTGTFMSHYFYTTVKTFISGEQIECYAFYGNALIDFDELARFGSISWDGVTRELRFVFD